MMHRRDAGRRLVEVFSSFMHLGYVVAETIDRCAEPWQGRAQDSRLGAASAAGQSVDDCVAGTPAPEARASANAGP